jgi:hypothetical protein
LPILSYPDPHWFPPGTSQRMHRGAELYQDPFANPVEDPTAMRGDQAAAMMTR